MITYKTTQVNGLKIAYREAGNPKNPTLVLLHGFPASSFQYRKVLQQDYNIYDSGHFALEEEGDAIIQKIRSFMRKLNAENRLN
ncbi:MAG: hypothetical protein ABJQ39_05900 [Winogradskyella arenosi]